MGLWALQLHRKVSQLVNIQNYWNQFHYKPFGGLCTSLYINEFASDMFEKMTIKVRTTQQWWISIKEQADASVEKFTFLVSKNNSSRLLRVSTSNGSVHFYPAFKVIFSLPVSLHRHYVQQQDRFLALRRLCLWERFKLVNQLENFPRKVSFWLRRSLWSSANSTVLFKFSNRHTWSSPSPYE